MLLIRWIFHGDPTDVTDFLASWFTVAALVLCGFVFGLLAFDAIRWSLGIYATYGTPSGLAASIIAITASIGAYLFILLSIVAVLAPPRWLFKPLIPEDFE
jgi:hypothetical protein